MRNDWYCPTCKEFMLYPERHKCGPCYEVAFIDFGYTRDDAVVVYADNPSDAAEKAAEARCHQQAEYDSMTNVHVWAQGTSHVFVFDVTIEAVPDFNASLQREFEEEAVNETEQE